MVLILGSVAVPIVLMSQGVGGGSRNRSCHHSPHTLTLQLTPDGYWQPADVDKKDSRSNQNAEPHLLVISTIFRLVESLYLLARPKYWRSRDDAKAGFRHVLSSRSPAIPHPSILVPSYNQALQLRRIIVFLGVTREYREVA